MAYVQKPVGSKILDANGNLTLEWQTFFEGLADDCLLSKTENYSKTKLPVSRIPTGAQIFVNDEAGGAVPAFWDGANWRRVTDRAIVS